MRPSQALQEDTTASRNDVAQLRTLLTSEERQFKPLPAAFFQKDPFEQLAKDLSTNSRVIEEIAKGRAAREHAHLEYENAQQRWDDQVKQARTHALTTFERNADRKGNFERGIHYEALIESKPEA